MTHETIHGVVALRALLGNLRADIEAMGEALAIVDAALAGALERGAAGSEGDPERPPRSGS